MFLAAPKLFKVNDNLSQMSWKIVLQSRTCSSKTSICLFCGCHNRSHYGSCPSLCPSVCL